MIGLYGNEYWGKKRKYGYLKLVVWWVIVS